MKEAVIPNKIPSSTVDTDEEAQVLIGDAGKLLELPPDQMKEVADAALKPVPGTHPIRLAEAAKISG